jgi:multidrug efflux pump subunit AcrA (membrane-fusion protein)
MKRVALFCVLLLAAVSIVGASWYGRREAVDASQSSARKILYYIDPMHPQYKADRPGKAPDCGMKLEPVYESRSHAASGAADLDRGVRVSRDMQRVVGVRVQPAERISGTEKLRLYGRVAPDETRIYRVNAGIDGYIREISAVTTGSHVGNGEWLATLAAPDARTPIQAYLVALEAMERGALRPVDVPGPVDAGVEQAADRLMTLGMSRMQIDEIRRTRMVPTAIRITAPSAGFVVARNLTAGEKIASGEELFRIADLRRVWILADLLGRDAEYVRPGMIADVTVPGRGTTIRATISSAVLPQFDALSQSARVRLEADNAGSVLRPEMLVDVHLPITLPRAIAVPVDAVLNAGLNQRVYVERADGAFEPRDVETGWRFGDRVEIVNGLADGDRVVVSGTFLLDSESRMRRAPGAAALPR